MLRMFLAIFCSLLPLLGMAKEKVCLNMIVKDESKVIKRCLDSVKPYIDYWVIMDTGSTDGTQAIIKNHMKGIPGELHERPWKNFGESRTEALNLTKGKGDFILFMDADDTLEFEPGFKFPPLTYDLYNMWRGVKGFTYMKPQLVRANLPWKWVGVTHEYLGCDRFHTSTLLEKVKYVSGDGGARSSGTKKFLENIRLLTEDLKRDPDNSRNVFYLAESYRDAGEKAKAIEFFQKRAGMGGWAEEVFWSKLQIAQILRDLDLPVGVVAAAYIDAHNYRPHRSEPIYDLAEVYNKHGKYAEAYQCIKAGELIEKPAEKDMLFNLDWIDDYGMLFQLSICSYYVGEYQESLEACKKLLVNKDLPDWWRKQTEINMSYPIAKINPPAGNLPIPNAVVKSGEKSGNQTVASPAAKPAEKPANKAQVKVQPKPEPVSVK